jgi:predicted DsbA family dithiol-disulfide isomerase
MEAAMPDTPREPVTVDVVSDVVCPWCFIGKHRLESALALKPEIPVEVRFHPYFLNPWVPREGMERADYLTRKFGSPEGYGQIAQRVKAAAAAEGLVYASEKMRRQPNTLDSHRLIRWAGEIGKAAAMKQRLMDLYFTEGGDLSDPGVLVQAAAAVGLDAAEIRARLATDRDIDAVEAQASAAQEAGINGVPFFIIGGRYAVSGAQDPHQLAEAIARAAAEASAPAAAE